MSQISDLNTIGKEEMFGTDLCNTVKVLKCGDVSPKKINATVFG
jgi:hypothetical protein